MRNQVYVVPLVGEPVNIKGLFEEDDVVHQLTSPAFAILSMTIIYNFIFCLHFLGSTFKLQIVFQAYLMELGRQ